MVMVDIERDRKSVLMSELCPSWLLPRPQLLLLLQLPRQTPANLPSSTTNRTRGAWIDRIGLRVSCHEKQWHGTADMCQRVL